MYLQKLFESFFPFRCSSNITMNDSLLLLCNNVINSTRRSMSKKNQVYLMNGWIEGNNR